jgi:hypothetical protein
VIGTGGLAPPTAGLSRRCSAKLSYVPKVTAGEGVEPSISSFKERHAASCTIPQNFIGAAGLEPASRADLALAVYKTAARPIELCPD